MNLFFPFSKAGGRWRDWHLSSGGGRRRNSKAEEAPPTVTLRSDDRRRFGGIPSRQARSPSCFSLDSAIRIAKRERMGKMVFLGKASSR